MFGAGGLVALGQSPVGLEYTELYIYSSLKERWALAVTPLLRPGADLG